MNPKPICRRSFSTFIPMLTLVVATAVSSANLAFGQESSKQEANKQDDRQLNDHLAVFAPYVGAWICTSEWKAGGEFWAKNDYSIGMSGNFFDAVTSTRSSTGGTYQRYKTTWVYNKAESRLDTYGFTFDGTVTITHPTIVQPENGQPIVRSKWQQADGTTIKQEVQMNDDGKSYQWRVWSSADEKEWTMLMDGVWTKTN